MTVNWIKNHALNTTAKHNSHIIVARKDLIDQLWRMWDYPKTGDYTKKKIKKEVDRLISTGQLIEDPNDGRGRLINGKIIFEEGVRVSSMASNAAKAIIDNLNDRKGIKHEIAKCDDWILEELENSIAAIIDTNVAEGIITNLLGKRKLNHDIRRQILCHDQPEDRRHQEDHH